MLRSEEKCVNERLLISLNVLIIIFLTTVEVYTCFFLQTKVVPIFQVH